VDNKSKDILTALGYTAVSMEQDIEKFCAYNTEGYDTICYIKLQTIYTILSQNKNVLLIDGDIVFNKNPLDALSVWEAMNAYDIWIQNDSIKNEDLRNMCTGYMFIKSNPKMIELYDCMSEKGRAKYKTCALDNNDQTYFNEYVKPYCNMYPLPLQYYPNGRIYYDRYNDLKDSAILVHFNWVKGHIKMAKMKEHKMWLLTEEEEEF
jgi:hypothetical protein